MATQKSIFDEYPEVENSAWDTSPGDLLKRQYLEPLNVSAYRLAKTTNLPQTRIGDIINKNRAITAETALKFARFFGTTAQFWMNIQTSYELRLAEKKYADDLELIERY
ncbi:MAG: HigA family addiction module antidote protein [Lentisphaeraceae bacterium]|nr:HigA family addiction module antidote protein [Lentisphaeraceae bacterium]